MNSVVKAGAEPKRLPTFQQAELLIGDLAALREDVAIAREPSRELLAKMDAVIAAGEASRAVVEAAAAPGKPVNVGSYLVMLLDAYPNSGSQNAKTFGGLLFDDVIELKPPAAAVEIACRRWRQRSKFPPAISELLEEVRAAKAQIENALDFMSRLPALRARAAKELGET
jgi:hypothetical protein